MSLWREKPLRAVIVLLLLFGPLYFLALGQSSLWEEDEAVYAEIAREMAESGDFVATFFNYAPRFDKPPLAFWLIALACRLFGTNEFAVRFFSALLGLAGLLLLYAMIRRTHGASAAFSSALILGSSLEYPALAMMGLTDMPLTFFTILTFYGLWRSYIGEDPRFYLLAGFAAAMATLAKGPIGLLLPSGSFALLVAVDLLLRRPVRGKILRVHFFLGFALYLAAAIPWYLMMWHRFGEPFLAQNFGYHMFTRFTRAIETHGGPFYYYLILIFVALLPWSAGLVGGIRRALIQRGNQVNILLLSWLGFYLLFFSAARTKLPGYLLPALPPAAVCTALWWEEFRRMERGGRERWLLPAALMGAGLLIALVFWSFRGQVPPGYAGLYRGLFLVPFALTGLGLAMLLLLVLTGSTTVIYTGFALLAVLGWMGIKLAVLPRLETYKPTRTLARAVMARCRPEERIAAIAGGFQGLPFYLRRRVEYISPAGAREFLLSPSRVYLVSTGEAAEKLGKEAAGTVVLLDSGPGHLLSNRPD